jgi:hypothetical protein
MKHELLSRSLCSSVLHSSNDSALIQMFSKSVEKSQQALEMVYALTLPNISFGATWRTQCTKQRSLKKNLHHIFVANQHIHHDSLAVANQSLLMHVENCIDPQEGNEILFCVFNGSVVNKHVTTPFH